MNMCTCVCVREHASVRVRAKRERMCAFAYFLTDSLQICWEHTMTQPKWQGLRTFNLRARAWLNIHLSLDGFSSNLLGTYYT
jgi:hypothetical protein